ncbi:MAG: MFS transporter [Ethanoligenens sp.]
MQYIQTGTKEARHASLGVLVGSTITYAIMYSPQPLISLYSQEYHILPATASLSISLTTVSLAVSLLFVTLLAGGFDRKRFMSVSLVLTSGMTIISAFLQNFSAFLVIRLLEGIAIAGFPSIAMAYLNEEFSPRDIGRVIGYYVAGTAVGGLTGRLIIGILTDHTNWHIAFLIQGAVSLAGALWFWLFLPDSRNFTKHRISVAHWLETVKKTLCNPHLWPMYITGFLLMGGYIAILDYIGYPLMKPPYNLSQTVFGFLFAVNLCGIFSSVLFGQMADRYPRRNVIALTFAVFITGVLLTLCPSLIIKILGVALVSFGFMAGHAVASGWTGLLAERSCKGQAASFYLLFYYTGSSLVGWSGGVFLSRSGWQGLCSYITLLLIAAFFVACQPWKWLSRSNRPPLP